jgi:hypothetical protein
VDRALAQWFCPANEALISKHLRRDYDSLLPEDFDDWTAERRLEHREFVVRELGYDPTKSEKKFLE